VATELLHGDVAPGWGPVADDFGENFATRGDVGAACSVYYRGQVVVDLWGGTADARSGRPWEHGTIACMNSVTKGAAAICALRLAERHELDLDAPICEVWPEFAARGKDKISLRMVMSHRAGLAYTEGLTPEESGERDRVIAAIAAQAPNWEPGTAQGYHAASMGWITGEVVRRVTGRSLGHLFAEEIAAPLGLELWIGLPEEEEYRFAPFVEIAPKVRAGMRSWMNDDNLTARVFGASRLYDLDLRASSRAFHAMEFPSGNGIGTARSVARMFAATFGAVDGIRLLAEATMADAVIVRSTGEPDLVIGEPRWFGTGFLLTPSLWGHTGPGAYGHDGAGGALGLADPGAGLGFGYLTNKMMLGGGHPWERAGALVDAAYRCADSPSPAGQR
jgi:CubicO group peptidase (beta-lactamase class C family)